MPWTHAPANFNTKQKWGISVKTMFKQPAKHRTQGFTIVELMAVLAISAILMALAVPSFTDSIRDNRVLSGAGNVLAVLNLARSEALAKGKQVAACGTSDPASVPPACDASWSSGWVIYVDDASKAVIKSGGSIGGVTMSGASTAHFSSKGRSVKADGTPAPKADIDVNPETCRSGVNKSIKLAVDTTGRVIYTSGKCT